MDLTEADEDRTDEEEEEAVPPEVVAAAKNAFRIVRLGVFGSLVLTLMLAFASPASASHIKWVDIKGSRVPMVYRCWLGPSAVALSYGTPGHLAQ